MVVRSLPLFALLTGCQALTDPCYQIFEDEPSRCVGEIVVDAAADPPTFDAIDLGPSGPSSLSVLRNDGDPCEGGVVIWELRRFSEADLPIRYGVVPDGARELVNEFISPDGSLIPLDPGTSYTVTFGAKSRLDASATSAVGWSANFVAGDPDSAVSYQDLCNGTAADTAAAP
jgi:hypothetical protein